MRRHPRYPTSFPCSLEAASGPAIAGTVVDISRGGAGIEAAAEVPEEFTLVFEHGGVLFMLPCAVRHSRNLWDRRKIHAQFRALSSEQQLAVDRLIETLGNGHDGVERRFGSVVRSLRRMLRADRAGR